MDPTVINGIEFGIGLILIIVVLIHGIGYFRKNKLSWWLAFDLPAAFIGGWLLANSFWYIIDLINGNPQPPVITPTPLPPGSIQALLNILSKYF